MAASNTGIPLKRKNLRELFACIEKTKVTHKTDQKMTLEPHWSDQSMQRYLIPKILQNCWDSIFELFFINLGARFYLVMYHFGSAFWALFSCRICFSNRKDWKNMFWAVFACTVKSLCEKGASWNSAKNMEVSKCPEFNYWFIWYQPHLYQIWHLCHYLRDCTKR